MTQGVAQRARSGEISATYRVYVLDWLIDSRHRSAESAAEHAQVKFGGRLPEDGVRVCADDEGGVQTYVVQVRRYTVAAEWKHSHAALRWAELIKAERGLTDDEIEVVGRNSRLEHRLRAYGQLMLKVET